MDSLYQLLCNAQLLPHLSELLKTGQRCYLVGGALRDWLSARPVTDFDLITPEDPTTLAKGFAKRIGGHWFLLDKSRRQSRVVLRREGELTFDFAPFRGPDLQADLKGRDFTLNALALDIHGPFGYAQIFDPLQGRRDLVKKILRSCGESSFRDDPLRVLRGIRLATRFGYSIEEQTLQFMNEAGENLPQVAAERVRAELAQIFSSQQARLGIELLIALGLGQTIFGPSSCPENPASGVAEMATLENGLKALTLKDANNRVGNLLATELDDGFSRSGLLKCCCFLRGYRPLDFEALLTQKLRLSRRNARSLACLQQLDPVLFQVMAQLPNRKRSRALWAEGLGPNPIDCLLFFGAMARPEKEQIEQLEKVLADYLSLSAQGRIPDLLDGRQLSQVLQISPGPILGRALEEVRQQEILGQIKTPEDARNMLQDWAQKNIDKGQGPPYNPPRQ